MVARDQFHGELMPLGCEVGRRWHVWRLAEASLLHLLSQGVVHAKLALVSGLGVGDHQFRIAELWSFFWIQRINLPGECGARSAFFADELRPEARTACQIEHPVRACAYDFKLGVAVGALVDGSVMLPEPRGVFP